MGLFLVLQNTEENFQKKILNERIARLSGGIAILQVIKVMFKVMFTARILPIWESGGCSSLSN